MPIRPFEERDTEAVVALWEDCGLTRPWNDPHRDIQRKLTTQPELFLVGVSDDDTVIATAMIGFDGHRGWVYYLAVVEQRRGEGHARALMAEAERLLIELGCPKLMLMVRSDNTTVIDVYEKLDYVLETTVVMGKRLIPDA
ncbi:MAG: family acetyltransferase [Glaciihabitans sp.]|nr:family acetyltransferase [Glaciihabitans sp.]